MEELPDDEKCAKDTQHWPHAPPHRLSLGGVYFVTARSADDDMKDWFQETLFTITQEFGWTLEAWAILSNHYHLIGHSPKGPDGAESLRAMIRKLHSLTTKELNRRENQPGRTRLWQNFRETCLTHQRSYLARLHYCPSERGASQAGSCGVGLEMVQRGRIQEGRYSRLAQDNYQFPLR